MIYTCFSGWNCMNYDCKLLNSSPNHGISQVFWILCCWNFKMIHPKKISVDLFILFALYEFWGTTSFQTVFHIYVENKIIRKMVQFLYFHRISLLSRAVIWKRFLTDLLPKRLQWFGECWYYNQLVITSSVITHSISIHHLLQNFRDLEANTAMRWLITRNTAHFKFILGSLKRTQNCFIGYVQLN